MVRPVLGVKGEKWPCAIKMKLEKVLALSFGDFPFSPVELCLSITHFDPLLSISCSGSHLVLPTHPRHIAAHKVIQSNDPVCGRQARFTPKTGGHGRVSEIDTILRIISELYAGLKI